jgi:resuscitation-promoting factor RpfB
MVSGRGWASAVGAVVLVVAVACGTQPSTASSVDLPDLVGLHLDLAKEKLEKADFDTMTSRDASGKDRSQIVDSNWTVCRQEPPPGPSETSTHVVLHVVKNTETCPEAMPTASSPAPTGESSSSAPAAPVVETRRVTETVPVPFDERTVDDPTLPRGTRVLRTPGVAGEKTLTYEVTLTDGVETGRRLISESVTRQPVSQIVAVGTAREPTCDTNYSGACVPIASDVDCAGGSGDGPAYVRGPVKVVGTDIYDLDRDGDGIACE